MKRPTMHFDSLAVEWQLRGKALTASAVVGVGSIANTLAHRLIQDPEHLCKGIITNDLLLVEGAANELPWVEGALYLGEDSKAPSLFMPTTLCPDKPIALVQRNLRKKAAIASGAIAVLPHEYLLIDMRQIATLQLSELLSLSEHHLKKHA